MKVTLREISVTLTLLVSLSASGPLSAQLPPETRWADPSQVQLNVEFPGNGYHASWTLYRCECGDLLVKADLVMPEEEETGELLLVEGKAVLIKGFGNYKAEAAPSLDAAALMMQLALRLLERSEPDGPAGITSPQKVDVLDEINHIYLDTGYAEGGFQAPWSIAGRISAPADTVRKFDLNFSFTVTTPGGIDKAAMRLYGDAQFAKTEFPVPETSAMDEWDLDWRDENSAIHVTATTLAELRAQLRGD